MLAYYAAQSNQEIEVGTSFRQSMAWLHTWTGLVVGWILYFMFVTGTIGYFYVEVDRWMRPELPLAFAGLSQRHALDISDTYLRREATRADLWVIKLPEPRSPTLWVEWRTGDGERVRREYDPTADRFRDVAELPKARATGGGFALYRMHWKLHYMPGDIAVRIIGICTMIMLVALLTGVVAHKKLFAEFFTFRPRKAARSWLDMHNLVSVTALPFFLMITISGLLFYPAAYVPGAALMRYSGELQQLETDFFPPLPSTPRANRAAPLLPLGASLGEADRLWGKGATSALVVRFPGDAASTIELAHSGASTLLRSAGEALSFDGVNGQLTQRFTALESAPRAITSVFYGLHEGIFADWALRWLYFLSGVLGCGMIGTGLVLWTVKRRSKHHNTENSVAGLRIVECLNVGTIVGLPVGVAAYFWANRLLPVEMAGRGAWEMHSLFLTWGVMLLWAAIRPVKKAWIEELSLAAIAFGTLPVLNALTTNRHLGVTLPAGDWGLVGFDLTMLATGALFGLAAVIVGRRTGPPGAAFRPVRSIIGTMP